MMIAMAYEQISKPALLAAKAAQRVGLQNTPAPQFASSPLGQITSQLNAAAPAQRLAALQSRANAAAPALDVISPDQSAVRDRMPEERAVHETSVAGANEPAPVQRRKIYTTRVIPNTTDHVAI